MSNKSQISTFNDRNILSILIIKEERAYSALGNNSYDGQERLLFTVSSDQNQATNIQHLGRLPVQRFCSNNMAQL